METTLWNKRQDFISEIDLRIPIGCGSYDYTPNENSDKYQAQEQIIAEDLINIENLSEFLKISSIIDNLSIMPGFYASFDIGK
jgi:hypothetical protein